MAGPLILLGAPKVCAIYLYIYNVYYTWRIISWPTKGSRKKSDFFIGPVTKRGGGGGKGPATKKIKTFFENKKKTPKNTPQKSGH